MITRRLATLLTLSALLFGTTAATRASISTNSLRLSVDVTADVRGMAFTDDEALSAGTHAVGSLLDVTAIGLPASVELDALIVHSNLVIFSTDTGFSAGGASYTRRDLVAYNVNTATLSLYFDGAANGLPDRVNLDAATLLPGTDDLLISIDVASSEVVAGSTVQDEDVILVSGGTASLLYAGGADLGIPARADVDALHHDGTNLYFSLDVGATLNAQFGQDEDVWRAPTNTLDVTLLSGIGIEARADLVSLDELLDRDGDGLTDFEEISGLDDPGTTVPGSDAPMDPGGYTSEPLVVDTDSDGASDSAEAVAGTDPRDAGDLLRMLAILDVDGTNVVSWTSVTTRKYILETAPEGTSAYTPLASGLTPTGPTNTVYEHSAPVEPSLLYRAVIDLSAP